MKKLMVLFMSLFLMVGCSSEGESSKDTSVTCKFDSGASKITSEVKVTYDGDKKITKIEKSEDSALMDMYFEGDKSEEEIAKQFEGNYINPKKKQAGMTFEISVDSKKKMLHVAIEMDPGKVTEIEMDKLGIKDYKDLDKLVKNLQGENYTCDEIK